MASGRTVQAILDHKGNAVYTVPSTSSVYHALQVMAEHNVGAVVVTCGEQLCGIFSERDYARKVTLRGRSARETTVGEIMTDWPVTVTPTHTAEDCMRFMSELRLRHLPVVDQGTLCGLVSIGDVVNWTIRQQEEEIASLYKYIEGSYPV